MLSEEINSLLARMNSTNLDGDDEPDVAQDVKAERTRGLEKVLESLRQLWDSKSTELDDLLQKLGTGSRDASWRIPIGDSGILDYALELLPHADFRISSKIQALRLIGNSCADTEENRARVVQGTRIPIIAGLLGAQYGDSLLPYVITSLHNICVDYEPAQTQAAEAGLAQSLAHFLETPRLRKSPHLIGITSKAIALVASTDREKDSANVSTPITLLRLASNPSWPTPSDPLEADDFCSLVSAASAYLTNDRLLAAAAAVPGHAATVLDALQAACTRFSCAELEDMDDADQLGRLRKSLVGVVADLTARDEFVSQHSEAAGSHGPAAAGSHGPAAATRALLATWLRRHPRSHLQEAACLALGNLACSDDAAELLVRQGRVHEPLVALLGEQYPYEPAPDDTVPSALLHAAVGLLKNLAIAPANKPALGATLLRNPVPTAGDENPAAVAVAVLPRLWGLADTQPQTQLATVSLCRLLLTGTPANGALLCAPLQQHIGADADSKTNTTTTTTANVRTNIHALFDLFRHADPEPTKTECARAAMALCRLLHQADADEMLASPAAWEAPPSSSRRAAFYAAHAALGELLSFLLVQARFPALRSEAWFVLALMSRSPDGAGVAARALTRSDAALAAVTAAAGAEGSAVEAVEKKSGSAEGAAAAAELGIDGLGLEPRQADPKQAANMAKVDRENVLVLLTELLRNQADDLSEDHRRKFEDALRIGGGIVVGERAEASGA
ncbi:hypothetical protein RB595_000438 [Gaeumannomyces hyphopodioides]